ncbi:MAG: hypothetical protein ACLFQV_04045 [Vulcanimicrobiota bacterium]
MEDIARINTLQWEKYFLCVFEYEETSRSVNGIYYTVYDGAGWSQPAPLSLLEGQKIVENKAQLPRIAFSRQNKVMCVFQMETSPKSENMDIYYATFYYDAYSRQLKWTPARKIIDSSISDISRTTRTEPQLVIDNYGNATFIYREGSDLNSSKVIKAIRFE